MVLTDKESGAREVAAPRAPDQRRLRLPWPHPTYPPRGDAAQVDRLLDTAEIETLIARIGETRQTGRPGYPVRTMVGLVLVKALYALPTWTRVVRLVADHAALRMALGIESDGMPSHWACYRFATKLRDCGEALDECIASVLIALHDEHPEMGAAVAIDGSDLPAYANGQRYLYHHGPERKVSSDPNAVMGSPFGHLDSQGRWLLWLQDSRRGGRGDRTADRGVGCAQRLATPRCPRCRVCST